MIYGGYKLAYPNFSWNQKLTISVNTPEGVETGDGIMSVQGYFHPKIFATSHATSEQGSASFVALPNNKYLFVFAKEAPSLTVNVFKDKTPNDDLAYDNGYKQFTRDLSNSSAKRDVNLDYDDLRAVYFSDINDPNTAYKVDLKDLAATFGEGYSLNALTLELTDETFDTTRIEQVIPWISNRDKLWGKLTNSVWELNNVDPGPYNYLRRSYFIRDF